MPHFVHIFQVTGHVGFFYFSGDTHEPPVCSFSVPKGASTKFGEGLLKRVYGNRTRKSGFKQEDSRFN